MIKKILITILIFFVFANIFLFSFAVYKKNTKDNCMYKYIQKYEKGSIYKNKYTKNFHIDKKGIEKKSLVYKKISNINGCFPEKISYITVNNSYYCYIAKIINFLDKKGKKFIIK